MTDDDDHYDLNLHKELAIEGLKEPILIQEFFSDENAGIGSTVWSASVRLAQFLGKSRLEGMNYCQGKVVLELGSGCCGLTGIVASKLGARKVIFTDLIPVLDFLLENVKTNIPDASLYSVCCLDWNTPVESFPVPDLIIAAECLYEVKAVNAFFNVFIHFKKKVLLCGIIGDDVFTHFKNSYGFWCTLKVVDGDHIGARSVFLLTPL